MTSAYAERYLDGAMDCLGEAFDYAHERVGVNPGLLMELFTAAGYAERFEAGEPLVVAGMSGTELAMRVLEETGWRRDLPSPREGYGLTPSYWCGWVLAYCQWRTCSSFSEIDRVLPADEVLELYHPLHEASEDRFVELFMERAGEHRASVRLQEQRRLLGITQRELAERAGVNLRTLQQYENRSKNINRAAGSTLLALARVLGCRMEDLLEPDAPEYMYAIIEL